MNCNYTCEESAAREAAYYFDTEGRGRKYLCEECYNRATDVLKRFTKPVTPTCNEAYGCDCKDCERVTHLGSSPASSGCTEIEPQDSFSSAKASVDCDACLSAIERTTKGGQRYQVDYNEERHSWGVVDTWNDDKFISHTTTLAGARVQRRRKAASATAWNA